MNNTFEIVKVGGHRGIRCLICGRISYNENDIENEYCGNCHQFHNVLGFIRNDKGALQNS